jgi:hypothetical protein
LSFTQCGIKQKAAREFYSDYLLVRVLAILDRRVGKRTLVRLADTIKEEREVNIYDESI